MWETVGAISLPRTKKSFLMTSYRGNTMMVGHGKAHVFQKDNAWMPCKSLGLLRDKISDVRSSQSGAFSVHLPKLTPLIAFHDNTFNAIVVTIPIPFGHENDEEPIVGLREVVTPEGHNLLFTVSHQRVGDVRHLFGRNKTQIMEMNRYVKDFAIDDYGNIIVVILENSLWVWQQMPTEVKGTGWWVDLAADAEFGFKNWDQAHNRAVAFRSMCAFSSPDEGSGLCLLTSLLPPCNQFDEMYLLNSICTFNGVERKIEKYNLTIPILTRNTKPEICWSPCGRLFVMCVNSAILVITRELRIIATTPLKEVFHDEEEAYLRGLAWSSNGQFFVLTSTTGVVSAMTRSGSSVLHCMCDLSPFSGAYVEQVPMFVTPDAKDPNLFVVYTHNKMRRLRVGKQLIPQVADNLLSLPFPIKIAEPLWDGANDLIRRLDMANPYSVVELLHFVEGFRIFDTMNPLRLVVWKSLNDGLETLLNLGHHALCFFLVRAAFRVCDKATDLYHTIIERLKLSTDKRDILMLRILEDELHRCDWVFVSKPLPERITFYEPNIADMEEMRIHRKAPEHQDVDLELVIRYVEDVLYNPDFMDVSDIPIDLSLLLELMIQLGRIDRAMVIAGHDSIVNDPVHLFIRIIGLHPSDPATIFQSLRICVTAAPAYEHEIRAIAVKAILNVLRERVSDTGPKGDNESPEFISLLCAIEESFSIPVPKTMEEMNDFAVIVGLALCAADYVNVNYFMTGRSKNIADNLRASIREIFRIVWFVRWRREALRDAAAMGRATNATLRLLAFPEFIDQISAKDQMREIGRGAFEDELFDLYVNGSGRFENDPAFVDFMCEATVRISPSILSHVELAVSSFIEEEMEKLPESGLLLAVITSHLVPWLRGAIPRAVVRFPAVEKIPNRLLEWEDWSLPEKPVVVVPEKRTLSLENSVEDRSSTQIEAHVIDDEASNAEVADSEADATHSGGTDQIVLPDSIPVPPGDHELSDGEEAPVVQKKKRRSERREKRERPQRPPEVPSEKNKREKPRLRLIAVDRSKKNFVPSQMPVPVQSQFQQGYAFNPVSAQPPTHISSMVPTPDLSGRAQSYGPIWDIDPNLYERPYPRPPPNIPLEERREPVVVTARPQPAERPPPQKVIVQITEKKERVDPLDISSDSDDMYVDLRAPRPSPALDPFPLDEELQRRVDRLLAQESVAKPTMLDAKPSYRRPATRDTP